MIDLREASEQLVESLRDEPSPIEALRHRIDRRRRRRLAVGGAAAVLVVAAVALGLATGDDSTSVVTSPSTTTSVPASDPEALAACQASVAVPADAPGAPRVTVVAAFTTTVAEVDAWMDRPGGGSVEGGHFPGVPPDDVLSICFEDGPFHPSFPPGAMPEAETNRSVSALHGTAETQLEVGPIDRIPIERPHPPTTRALELDALNGPLTVVIPATWHVADRSLTPNLRDPKEVVTVASMAIGPDVEDARCAQFPVAALSSLGDDDVLLSVQEWSAATAPADHAEEVPPPGVEGRDESLECLTHPPKARTWLFSVQLGLRSVLVYVAAGQHADDARLAEVWQAVESLNPGSSVGATKPPPLPTGA